MNYQISITQKCNLNCTYCYEKNKNYKDYMNSDMIKKTCDFIVEDYLENHQHDNFLGINITGGEPLLHFESVKFIISYLEQKFSKVPKTKIHFEISTNATLFDKQKLDFLNKNNISLFIGTDGIEKSQNLSRKTIFSQDSFQLVNKNIKELINYQNLQFENISFNMVVTPDNVKYMYKNYKYLLNLSQNREISVNPALEENWNPISIRTYKHQLRKINKKYYEILIRKKGNFSFLLTDKQAGIILANNQKPSTIEDCGAGVNILTITTHGTIIPCAGFLYSSNNTSFLEVGNIYKKNLETNVVKFRDKIKFDLSSCKDCKLLYKCVYFCPANNYKTTGNMNKPSYSICELNKANIIETERFLEYFFRKNKTLFIQKYKLKG